MFDLRWSLICHPCSPPLLLPPSLGPCCSFPRLIFLRFVHGVRPSSRLPPPTALPPAPWPHRRTPPSFIVFLYGPWFAGKSSLLYLRNALPVLFQLFSVSALVDGFMTRHLNSPRLVSSPLYSKYMEARLCKNALCRRSNVSLPTSLTASFLCCLIALHLMLGFRKNKSIFS